MVVACFVDELLAGRVSADALDDFVDAWHATPSSTVNAYDRVVVFVLPNVIDKVNKFFI